MVMPGMGIDPQQLARVQEVSKNIKADIIIDYEEYSINMSLSSSDERAKAALGKLPSQLAEQLAMQLGSFFAITGHITEKGKPREG